MHRTLAALMLVAVACAAPEPGPSGEAFDAVSEPGATRITWSGIEWLVKYGDGKSPGNNAWRTDNVFVDDDGALHLRVQQDQDGKWTCAEIWSVPTFGWGTYRFDVVGRLDELPAQAVLGLFNIRRSGDPLEPTSEIDIEYSAWGAAPPADRGSFTLWGPDIPTGPIATRHFPVTLFGTYTSHAFEWRRDGIRWESRHGHGPNGVVIDSRSFAMPEGAGETPRSVHLNLWLFRGQAPASAAEVVVQRFEYAP